MALYFKQTTETQTRNWTVRKMDWSEIEIHGTSGDIKPIFHCIISYAEIVIVIVCILDLLIAIGNILLFLAGHW